VYQLLILDGHESYLNQDFKDYCLEHKVLTLCMLPCCQEVREQGEALRQIACTIYTVPHTMIDVNRLYVPFWLHGVAGADLRPDTFHLLPGRQ
jgi:hypothetical protein